MGSSSFSTLITLLSGISIASRALRFARFAGIIYSISPIRIWATYQTFIIIIKVFDSRWIFTASAVIRRCLTCDTWLVASFTFKRCMNFIIPYWTIFNTFIIIDTFEIRDWISWVYLTYCAFIKSRSITGCTTIFTF